MFRSSRTLHRWIGVLTALFLILIAATGFLLANKSRVAWLRPPVVETQSVDTAAKIVSVDTATRAAFALGHPELRTMKDVDRVDYRPKNNVFKVISRDGYREVQVCGARGTVLSSSFRGDQFVEDLHDFTWFAEWAHAWLLPLVAIGLFSLGVSGIVIFFTPVIRRWRFRRQKGSG